MTRARQARMVDEDNGRYQVNGGEDERWSDVAAEADTVEVVESLMGWAPYRWAVKVTRGGYGMHYFLTGANEPREKRANA